MSFSNLTDRNDYIGNGFIATYDYIFKIFSDTHLLVLMQDAGGIETTLQLYAHYTVSGVGRATGGTITLTGGPLIAGHKLAIIRHLPFGQPTDLRNMGGYFPETVEDQLDRLAMTDMQLADRIDHTVQVPLSLDVSTLDLTLPNPEPGFAIGWNEDGDALVNIPVTVDPGTYLPRDGSLPMTGPLRVTGDQAGVFYADRDVAGLPPWGDWETFAESGVFHWRHNGIDKMTIAELGAFFSGRVFGNGGGIGLGRITISSTPPPSDGQEGDIHFQI